MANTMANKKSSKRKFVAVGLGLVGIAGLSVASAAQFDLTAGNEAAIGESTFAACVDSADVELSYNSATQNFDAVNVTNIVDAEGATSCENMDVYVTLDGPGDSPVFTGQGIVDGGSADISIDGGLPVETEVGDVSVVIG